MHYCGIDIAKRKHVAVVVDEKGEILRPPLSVENTRPGFDQLGAALAQIPGQITIGLEATGHYWLALYEYLTRLPYSVVVFNPLQIHAYRRSGLRKVKNDRSDAVWIADFLRIGNRPPTAQATPLLLQLKELTRFRMHLSQQIGDIKRKILGLLDRVFPEYEKAFSSVFLASSRQLLARAASAQEVAEFDLSELTELLRKSSSGRFGRGKADTLQALARESVGVTFLTDAAQVEIKCLLDQLDLLELQRQRVDQVVKHLMAQIPQFITTITGIGAVTGAAILAEIGDVSRFSTLEKLVGYAGIDATVYQTGEFEGTHRHMSKRGSPYLRLALWQAAFMAIQHDPELRAYYDRKRAEGKAHGTVLGAICRKLLARIYVVLKEQRPYLAVPA